MRAEGPRALDLQRLPFTADLLDGWPRRRVAWFPHLILGTRRKVLLRCVIFLTWANSPPGARCLESDLVALCTLFFLLFSGSFSFVDVVCMVR